MSSLILIFLFGVLCGISASVLCRYTFYKPVGTLRIDASDPDENPYLFLEVSESNFSSIAARKSVELTVQTTNYIPRE